MSSSVPAACSPCQRVFLASLTNGNFCCPACGAEARVVPGCNFAATDGEMFEELAQLVSDARLGMHEARRLAAELQQGLSGASYAALLGILTTRLPGLTPVQAAVDNSPRAQRQMLTMLRVIFEAKVMLGAQLAPAYPLDLPG